MYTCESCHRTVTAPGHYCPFCGAPAPTTEPEAAARDPIIGQTIDRKYLVHELIGEGGMGRVYKATHLTLERTVVLKMLNRNLLADASIVQRFHREARAASRLNHPNSISVMDFGQMDDGTLYIVMEYLAGRSLAKVIEDDYPIAEGRVVRIVSQILAALGEAHALGIIHRDLKPANVMVEARRDEHDFVKVLDFGIAKLNEPERGEAARLTQAGIICGTPGYMSPEQVRGEELDPRSDLYSVGVIMYELVTGSVPFEADTPMGLLTKHLTEPPIPPRSKRRDIAISAELEALILRALAKDRAGRPASAEEMRAELLACPITAAPPRPASPARTAAYPGFPIPSGGGMRAPTPPAAAPSPAVAPAPPRVTPQPSGGASAGAPLPVSSPVPRTTPQPSSASPGLRPPVASGAFAPLRPRGQTPPPEPVAAQPTTASPPPPRTPAPATEPSPSDTLPSSRRGARAQPSWPSRAASAPEDPNVTIRDASIATTARSSAPAPSRPVPHPATEERDEEPDAGEAEPTREELAAAGLPRQGRSRVVVMAVTGVGLFALLVVGWIVFRSVWNPAPLLPELPGPIPTPEAPAAETAAPAAQQAPAAQPSAPSEAVQEPSKVGVATTPVATATAPEKPAATKPSESPAAAPRPRKATILQVSDALKSLRTPPVSSGEGILSIVATPWAVIAVDGQQIGETPRELRVTAGVHRVRATHPSLGTRDGSVAVESGKRRLWTVTFEGK